jgi:hypothetical protein
MDTAGLAPPDVGVSFMPASVAVVSTVVVPFASAAKSIWSGPAEGIHRVS